ncbi:MAG: amidohydrolase [Bacteroidia bacterium]|nr:amidohydrolase [Bacteroidia bacterium]
MQTQKIKDKIKAIAENIYGEVVSYRRHLHSHPELSFEEKETALYVQARLTEWGIPFQKDFSGHGVVGIIQGKPGGKTIALRADMDALPVQELNETEYKSLNPGIMHACGHDVHTSSLLGTAYILQQLKEEWEGSIKLIFQPAEEKVPGGASLMIKDGVLHNPKVESIYGQHVQPFIDCGKIGIRAGKYMASADELYLTIKGKGGHGAQPQHCIDPIIIAASVLTTLQTVISRNADPRSPSVLTFGKIAGGTLNNIIPDEVYLEGTFRAMNETWRFKAHEIMRNIITSVTESMGGTADFEIRKGYPVLFNDETLTNATQTLIEMYAGKENVIQLDLWMAAEDFAFYTHEIPGCFYRLGTRNTERGIIHGLHSAKFDIDEEALRLSTGLMAWIAINQAAGKENSGLI